MGPSTAWLGMLLLFLMCTLGEMAQSHWQLMGHALMLDGLKSTIEHQARLKHALVVIQQAMRLDEAIEPTCDALKVACQQRRVLLTQAVSHDKKDSEVVALQVCDAKEDSGRQCLGAWFVLCKRSHGVKRVSDRLSD